MRLRPPSLARLASLAAFGIVALAWPALAKDYGQQGAVFVIIEPDVLTMIEAKLRAAEASGKIAAMNKDMAKRTTAKVKRPPPVTGIVTATAPRSWTYDPTITVGDDIRDNKGTLIIPRGRRIKAVNADPYSYVSGFSAGGAQGTCVAIPSAAISPGTYEQTCNSGYVQDPGAGPQTCQVTLDHQFQMVHKYECSELNAATNGTDDCATFAGYYPGTCTYTGSRPGACLLFFGPPSFGCAEPGEPVTQLSCSSLVPGGTLLSSENAYVGSTVNDSACATWKADANCTPDPDICTDSTPVTRIVSGVAVTQPCWAWDRTYQCSGPLVPMSDCSELDALGCTFVREQCITDELPCLTVDRVYACPIPPVPATNQQICDADVYCINGECDRVDRSPNTEFKDALVALNSISQAGKEFDENTLEIFKGNRLTCSKTIFGLTNCCVPRGFPLLGGCNGEDQILKGQREQGLCTYVGTYCDQKFLGICLRKKEAHCCFVSKISRILQEQGRPQIGKPWGDPKTEQCAGFTITEFQQLDLSLMDFSEVYAEFTEAAQIPADLDVIAEMQAKIDAFYAANGP